MGVQAVDYRVSTLVVLCKDCSQDVGLYPARHKCLPVDRPAMPSLPSKYQRPAQHHPSSLELNSRTMSSTSTSSNTSSSPSPSFSSVEQPTSKWSTRLGKSSVANDHQEGEDSIYFNNFASNLPEDQPSGKKLWGKIKQNEKWKQLSEKNDKPKQSGKLWGKLMQATQTMADKIPSRDDRGAESDEDDWEGETHVSRILREYYEKKQMRLPEWLFDGDVPRTNRKQSSRRVEPRRDDYAGLEDINGPTRTPSRRRLWEQNPEDANKLSSRERERQELRQAQPPPAPVPSGKDDRYNHEDRYNNRSDDRLNYRNEDRYSNRRNEDRYNNRDYSREDRYSHEDHYSHEDRQRSNDRGYRGDRNSGRQREQEDHYGSKHHDRYNDRYEDSYRRDDYRDHRSDRQPSSRRYDNEPVTDNYYNQRPRSPPQQPQHSKSTGRSRYYDDEPSAQQPPRSERSARGFQREQPRSNKHHNNDFDDYYYNSAPDRRDQPPPSTGSRRYGNDPSYF